MGEKCVAKLIAKNTCAGLGLPLTAGRCTLSEGTADPLFSVAPFVGQAKAVAKALKPLGLTFPAPNSITAKGPARLVWAGRDMAFLIGAEPPAPLHDCTAVTDQSDGWSCLTLHGDGAEDVLARLITIDPRLAAFAVGTCAKVMLNHMQALIIRTAADSFDILVFRSMTRTAVQELHHAMDTTAARAALPAG